MRPVLCSQFDVYVHANLAKLSLATSIDPIDARVSLGNGLTGPSEVTKLLMEIGDLMKNKQFDFPRCLEELTIGRGECR
jgi:hypothetical protein